MERQHSGGFDPRHIEEYHRQLGVKYYLTGKVSTADERTTGARRVQYFMFLQLIEVATSSGPMPVSCSASRRDSVPCAP